MFEDLTRGRAVAAACTLALALGAAAPVAEAGFIEFGSQFANITATNLTPADPFNVNFTGSLGLSGNANSIYLGALLDGGFVGNPSGFQFLSLTGQIDFNSGAITGGFLQFSVTQGGVVNTFDADFLASVLSISHNPILNEFSITGTLGNIDFSHSTFAGFDVSSLFGQSGIVGSFFGFNYNGQEVDPTAGLIATAIVPAPAAFALFGVAAICGARRRRTS